MSSNPAKFSASPSTRPVAKVLVATTAMLAFISCWRGDCSERFEVSEKVTKKQATSHAELDKFNLTQAGDLTLENVGVKPANVLAPISTYDALYPLEAALARAKRREAEIVVLHVRLLRRAASGEFDLAPDQLFTAIEQAGDGREGG
jgi:hypothetical protein